MVLQHPSPKRRLLAKAQRRRNNSSSAETTVVVSATSTLAAILFLLALGAGLASVYIFYSNPRCMGHVSDAHGWMPDDLQRHQET